VTATRRTASGLRPAAKAAFSIEALTVSRLLAIFTISGFPEKKFGKSHTDASEILAIIIG
jgi:hypothetical protein